jgi:ketosteroid isomerase-like protein
MSEENAELVRRAIRHVNETDEPDLALYDSELVWTTRPDGPAHNTYRGLEGLRQGTRSLRGVWAEVKGEIIEIVGEGNEVVAVIRWELRSQQGVELEVTEAWATWIEDGKIVRIEQHGDRREALEAAGLSE